MWLDTLIKYLAYGILSIPIIYFMSNIFSAIFYIVGWIAIMIHIIFLFLWLSTLTIVVFTLLYGGIIYWLLNKFIINKL
jgi:hypothetical protein